jgi:hypothetical protein
MIKRTTFLLLAALCITPGFAAEGEKRLQAKDSGSPDAISTSPKPSEAINLKISYKMKLDASESVGSFVTQSGAQSNNVVREGAYNAHQPDGSGERRTDDNKRGIIVNCLPILMKGKIAHMELQTEMIEPLEPSTDSKAASIKTFQYQGMFLAALGRTIVLVDAPDRHLEMTVEELPAK